MDCEKSYIVKTRILIMTRSNEHLTNLATEKNRLPHAFKFSQTHHEEEACNNRIINLRVITEDNNFCKLEALESLTNRRIPENN